MKKIIVLIISVLLLTGCYDNIDLNNLAIITSVGIDYIDDNFYLTYEILNDIKTENNTAMLSYTLSGSGKNISEAFEDVNYKVGKKPFFDHLKIVILSESIINGQLDKITDYLIRDTNIRDEFIMMVAHDVSPEDILKNNSDNNPVVSDLIMNLIDNEKYNNNLSVKEFYQHILVKFISKEIEAVLGSVTIKDGAISLDNFDIFRGYNYTSTLSKNESSLYSFLTQNVFSLEFSKIYDDNTVTINITSSKPSINVTKDEINIKLDLSAKILDNSANLNLKKQETYKKLDDDFKKIIEEDVIKFIKVLQENKSDILGLQEIYFKNTRKKNKGLWEKAKVNVDVDLKVNTKGYIFEVEK